MTPTPVRVALLLALGAMSLSATAQAQAPRKSAVFKIDGDDMPRAGALRQAIASRVEADERWQLIDSEISFEEATVMICGEPSPQCVDLIAEQLSFGAFIHGSLTRQGDGLRVVLTWHERGTGTIARMEATYDSAEAFDQAMTRLADDLVSQTAPPPEQPPGDEPPSVAVDDLPDDMVGLRVTPKLGASVPRTELGSAMALSMEISYDLPLGGLSSSPYLADRLRLAFEAGYQLLAQKDTTIIPGRGRTSLIQNSHVIPMNLLALYSAPAAWPLQPYGGAGLGMLISRSDFQAFSQTQPQNDFSLGAVFVAGAQYPMELSPGLLGHLTVEVQHREAQADMGDIGEVGQDSLAATSFTAGFGLEF